MPSPTPIRVGILIFDQVEVLDFAGPYEVFAAARQDVEPGPAWRTAPKPFDVFTVAGSSDTVESTGGLRIEPAYSFDSAPAMDHVIVPGGFGVRAIIDTPETKTLAWLRQAAERASLTASVCTGAWILAKAGLLAHRRATSHFLGLDRLRELDSSISVQRDARVVEDGPVMTAGGVSSGIDLALRIVARTCGEEAAANTARYIEYHPERSR